MPEKSAVIAMIIAGVALLTALYVLGALHKANRDLKAVQTIVAETTDEMEQSVIPALHYLNSRQEHLAAICSNSGEYQEEENDDNFGDEINCSSLRNGGMSSQQATAMEEMAAAMLSGTAAAFAFTPMMVTTTTSQSGGPLHSRTTSDRLPRVEEVDDEDLEQDVVDKNCDATASSALQEELQDSADEE